jgi:hypothetical protein
MTGDVREADMAERLQAIFWALARICGYAVGLGALFAFVAGYLGGESSDVAVMVWLIGVTAGALGIAGLVVLGVVAIVANAFGLFPGVPSGSSAAPLPEEPSAAAGRTEAAGQPRAGRRPPRFRGGRSHPA